MDLWYSELHTDNVKFSIKIDKQLHSSQSEFQRIDVFDSPEYGRFLTLDGYLMLTEKDDFIYHEMLVHIPLAVNLGIKKVLVIGAGNGGVARELTDYKTIEQIDVVEIDEQLVEVAKEFFPYEARGFEDKRVKLYVQDALKFMRHSKIKYDLIIVDSSDPYGPGEVLFTKEFYGHCYNILEENGILVNQHESPFYENDANILKRIHTRISKTFEVSQIYEAHIPSFPAGHWTFGFASKGLNAIKDLQADAWNALDIDTEYYNTDLHCGAFALPNYVKELLK